MLDKYEFVHNGKLYFLAQLQEPKSNKSYDIIAIFEINGCDYKFINYFYGVDQEEELIKIAKSYID